MLQSDHNKNVYMIHRTRMRFESLVTRRQNLKLGNVHQEHAKQSVRPSTTTS